MVGYSTHCPHAPATMILNQVPESCGMTPLFTSPQSYFLDASAGQTMTVTVTGGAVVDVFGPGSIMMQTGSNVTVSPLPTTGTYFLDVYSESCAALSYDLLVDIPASGASGGNACPSYTQFTTADGQDWPMRRCQQGQLVRDVQQALKDEGFDVDVDGLFGPGTASTVGQWRGDGVGELIPSTSRRCFGSPTMSSYRNLRRRRPHPSRVTSSICWPGPTTSSVPSCERATACRSKCSTVAMALIRP